MAKAEYKSAIRSRRMLQRALVELLQEKELDKITVTDIVTRADINRGTFYAHYADISGVLDSIMENVCQTIREALENNRFGQKLQMHALCCSTCSACWKATRNFTEMPSAPMFPTSYWKSCGNSLLNR